MGKSRRSLQTCRTAPSFPYFLDFFSYESIPSGAPDSTLWAHLVQGPASPLKMDFGDYGVSQIWWRYKEAKLGKYVSSIDQKSLS